MPRTQVLRGNPTREGPNANHVKIKFNRPRLVITEPAENIPQIPAPRKPAGGATWRSEGPEEAEVGTTLHLYGYAKRASGTGDARADNS